VIYSNSYLGWKILEGVKREPTCNDSIIWVTTREGNGREI